MPGFSFIMESVGANGGDAVTQNGITDGTLDQKYVLHPWYDILLEEELLLSGSAQDDSDSGSDETDGQEWRDPSKQRQFRDTFAKNNPNTDISKKHASHTLSIEVAVCIKERYGLSLDDQQMRKSIGARENFRMVKMETNLQKHRRIDAALMEATPDTMLTKEQEKRARQQLKVLRTCEFPSEFKRAGEEFYRNIGIF